MYIVISIVSKVFIDIISDVSFLKLLSNTFVFRSLLFLIHLMYNISNLLHFDKVIIITIIITIIVVVIVTTVLYNIDNVCVATSVTQPCLCNFCS